MAGEGRRPAREIPAAVLARLRHNALYRLNSTFANPPWNDASLRVLIVRLSPYDDVAQSFAHLFLAQEVRRAGTRIYLDFAFLPGAADRRALKNAGAPPLFGIQSHRCADGYDVLLVSLAYIPELINLPWLLRESGLPACASERDAPLVVVGGSAVLAAGALVSPDGDPVPDAFFIGEGEGRVEQIVRELEACLQSPHGGDGPAGVGTRGASSAAALKGWVRTAAGRIDGVWAPKLAGPHAGGAPMPTGADAARSASASPPGAPGTESTGPSGVRAARCDTIGPASLTTSYPVLPGPEATTARLQITYGCRYRCAFCLEGQTRRPYREVPAQELLVAADMLRQQAGATRVEVSSYNYTSHGEIGSLLVALNQRFDAVNLMSQRPDELARDPDLLGLLLAAEKRSFTLGVEGISERLRRFLEKGVTAADLQAVIPRLLRSGIREIKLFFILTGYEQDNDFAEFGWLCDLLRAERELSGARTRVIVSANRLIRMPFTPLAFDPPRVDRAEWDALLDRAATVVATHGLEMRAWESWDDYLLQQLLASNPPGTHDAVMELSRRGLVYDGPASGDMARVVADAVSRSAAPGAAPTKATADRANVASATAAVAKGATPAAGLVPGSAALRERYERLRSALSQRDTTAPARLPRHAASGPPPAERVDRVIRARRALPVRYFRVHLPPDVAGMGSEWLAAWLTRTIRSRWPDQGARVVRCSDALWSSCWGDEVAWYGASVAGIAAWEWDDPPFPSRGAEPEAVGDEIPGFQVEAFSRATVRVVIPADHAEAAEDGMSRFLAAAHVPATVHRDPDGWLRAVVSPRGVKARVILSGRWGRENAGFVAELEVGRRFRAADLVDALAGPRDARAARYAATVDVKGIGLRSGSPGDGGK